MKENHKNNRPGMKDIGAKNKENEERVSVSKEEYEALRKRASERDAMYDQYLRSCAELENAKKRFEREKADVMRYATEGIIIDFLPILDNLEIAEKHMKEAKDFEAVRQGVDMIQLQIQDFLREIGLERLKVSGEKFDPHQHEAVETEESKEKENGLIVEELKAGYTLNGRLLRPAVVKIVKNTSEEV